MFKDISFKAMESSLDALWMKQKVHSNNISNLSTPGFKTRNLVFEDILTGIDGSIGGQKHDFRAKITTNPNSSLPDGNNVNIETEEMELYKTYVQTAALYQQVSTNLKNNRYVINNTLK